MDTVIRPDSVINVLHHAVAIFCVCCPLYYGICGKEIVCYGCLAEASVPFFNMGLYVTLAPLASPLASRLAGGEQPPVPMRQHCCARIHVAPARPLAQRPWQVASVLGVRSCSSDGCACLLTVNVPAVLPLCRYLKNTGKDIIPLSVFALIFVGNRSYPCTRLMYFTVSNPGTPVAIKAVVVMMMLISYKWMREIILQALVTFGIIKGGAPAKKTE
jgi:hypothetical protein